MVKNPINPENATAKFAIIFLVYGYSINEEGHSLMVGSNVQLILCNLRL
jgi:ABC-type tungstate transport system substrate-binding protein